MAIAQENYDRWTMQPTEYLIVHERETMRLRKYAKSFDEDVLVKMDGVPLIMKSSGKALRAVDVYPERADLAIAEDGTLLSQAEFTSRYVEWLEGHVMSGDPAAEIIPNVVDFVSLVSDRFSESNGMIEQYFDPKRDEEFSGEAEFDTDGRRRGEDGFAGDNEKASSSLSEMLLAKLVDKLTPEQVAEMLQEETGAPVIGEAPAGNPGDDAEDGLPLAATAQTEDQDEAEPGTRMWRATCGDVVRMSAKGNHIRHCSRGCKPGDQGEAMSAV